MSANDVGAVPVSGEINQPEKLISAASAAAGEEDEMRLLDDVVRSFPPEALKCLLSYGVCPLCILRLFGKYGPSYSNSTHVWSLFSSVAGYPPNSGDHSSQGSGNEDSVCNVCCGILQFVYVDEKQASVKKECANDMATSVSGLVREEGHQVDGFSLEVSVPPFILENENVVRLFMKEKYGSEVWLKEMLESEAISVKDALKLYLTKPLETQFGVKAGSSSFRLRLTYTKLPMKTENGKDYHQDCKRRKTGFANSVGTGNGSDLSNPGTDLIMKKSSNHLQDKHLLEPCKLGKVSACSLAILCNRTPVYIGGRYLKYSRNVSQTRWIIDDERMGEASIEEIVGGGILPLCRGDSYKFHAAGREDIDVRMLGSGRPFLLEIQNPRVLPSEVSLNEMEVKINSFQGKLVKVKNLKVVNDQGWTMMREGEAEKQKQYAALVWISRPLEDKDMQAISSMKEMKVLQRTPVRVLHRRSPLEREKIIHWMNIEKIAGTTQYFLLHLCTQAGTYIKEFVHGDLGRTHPSLGSILGCRTEILQLDVTDVKMDCFLT